MSPFVRRLPVPLSAIVAALAASSCGLFCDEEPHLSCGGPSHRSACSTEGGCDDAFYWGGLVLDLPPLVDGSYRLEGSADGEPFSCPFTISAGEPDVRCLEWETTWLDSDLVVGLAATPCRVTIDVRDGQGVVAGGSFRPDYAWDRPGGPDCNEWRALARVSLAPASR